MTNKLLLTVLLSTSAFAQGYMTSVTLDGGDTLWGDLTMYPGSGRCSGLSAWSNFAGNWASGTAPTTLQQAIQNAPPDSSFTWDIGFTESVPDPYGGCYSTSWTSYTLIRTTTTYYGPPVTQTTYSLGQFTCEYGSLACTSGTPTCTQDNSNAIVADFNCPVPLADEGVPAVYIVVNGSSCEFGFLWNLRVAPPRKCT